MATPAESKILRFLAIVYFAEAGAFLSVAPWSLFWIRRIVARSPAFVQPLLLSPYFRSFLVGLGVIHLVIAFRDLEAWRKASWGRTNVAEGNAS